MKAQKETKWVCIQLACSWRPRAFEEAHHWNIQAKFYNEKFPLVIYESEKIGDSLSWRTWCYFEAQVWKKDSNIAPSLFFSHFFSFFLFFLFCPFFGAFFFFIWPFSFFFLTWDNALIMKIITLLFTYNSRITTRYLEQNMTLYECLRRCTGMCNDSRVTCMKELWTVALPQIRCQLHDHAKQYDNDDACHNKRNGGKLHGNISRNGYGNAMIGRYGGCFEEGIWWLFWGRYMVGCAVLERLAMVEGWECV